MRSRYTAYTQADTDYIQDTMRGKAAQGYNSIEAKAWALQCEWIDLRVVNAKGSQVEFVARFRQHGAIHFIHELSDFVQQDGRWYYIDGLTIAEPGRNTTCPCGSGKKYKRCCGH